MPDETVRKTELRLFLSSTFRDLQSEREYLVKKIFPEIRALCRSRGVTFTEVDLRWGLTEEQQRLGRIIRTCLEEIERCQPFFIGIVGKRYGWAPEYHEVLMDPEIQERYPWIEETALEGGSLLEMEFTAGLKHGSAKSAFFYRRDDPREELDEPQRLDQLIEKVRAEGMEIKSFDTPASLGNSVRTDLIAMIEAFWPAGSVPSMRERERQAHEAFAHSRRRAYIPNPEYLKEFREWLANGTTPLLVCGSSGMGKSALLTWLAGEYKKKRANAFVIEHYVGASDDSTDHLGFIRRIIDEIQTRYGTNEEVPSDADALERTLVEWLSRVGKVEGFEDDELYISLDAVDQFLVHSQTLSWLPKSVPPNVRLIVSARDGEALKTLASRNWDRLELRTLREREREAIIARYLGEYHKQLNSEMLQRISADEKAASPLFLRTLAEELRMHGRHETLAKTVDHYLSAGNLEDLFTRSLERMEQDFGVDIVRRIAVALAVSRAGLSETHLMEAAGVARVELSMLLTALDYHLLRSNGRVHFFHNYLRRAIEARYLADADVMRTEHERLGEYFYQEFTANQKLGTATIDPSIVREMLYQFFMADSSERLQQMLLVPVVFDIMFEGDSEYEFLRYWKSLDGANVAELYGQSFKDEIAADDGATIDRLLKLAHLYRIVGLWNDAESGVEQAVSRAEILGDAIRSLRAWGELGDLLMLRGKHDAAYEAYKEKRALAKSLGRDDVAAVAAGDIGGILLERGEYDEALRRFETMIEACARINNKRGVAHGLMKIGQIKRLTGDYESATDAFARSLELYESLADKRLIATVLGHIGLVNWNRGEFDEAMNCFREEAECMKTIGDTNGYAIAAGKIGLVELDRGDLEKAAQSFNEYLKITSELGYSRGIGFACGDLGLVALQQSRFDDANAYFDKALAIHRGIEFPEGTSMWLRWKTEASLLRGDVSESAGSWNAECIEIATLIGKSDVLFDADVQRYRLAHALGKHAEAIAGLRQLSDVHLNEVQQAEINYWLWKLTDENELPLRSEHKKRAAELYRSLGDRSGKSLYRKRLSELSDQADDH